MALMFKHFQASLYYSDVCHYTNIKVITSEMVAAQERMFNVLCSRGHRMYHCYATLNKCGFITGVTN